eukprot:38613-Chlamydomonas_euryale.AAC.2
MRGRDGGMRGRGGGERQRTCCCCFPRVCSACFPGGVVVVGLAVEPGASARPWRMADFEPAGAGQAPSWATVRS